MNIKELKNIIDKDLSDNEAKAELHEIIDEYTSMSVFFQACPGIYKHYCDFNEGYHETTH